ncbi:MAG: hypothetical protein ACR2QW_09180 [bacterium]
MRKLFYFACLIVCLGGCTEQGDNLLDLAKNKLTAYKGDMNISCFVYRDVNRNGVYDLNDRPYSGLRFTLERPDRDPALGSSNIAGFANFNMSLNNTDKPIATPGIYKVIAKPRGDWQVTSGNLEQHLEIKEMQGSPGGLVATKTLVPLGVAPVLSISGQIELSADDDMQDYRIVATSFDGTSAEVEPIKGGKFSLPASPGEWQVALVTSDGTQLSRSILVGDYPVLMSGFSPHKEYSGSQYRARTVGFDELTQSDTLYEIPNGYGGLNWHNWISTHQKFYQGSGYINATVSGEFLAYNSSGHPATVSSDNNFDLHGFYIGVAWPKAELSDVLITAWRNDEIAYRDHFRLTTTGPVWFAADYKNITRIEFSTEKYWQLVIDDLNYSQQ